MDNENPLIPIDAEGGLPVSPCIRFNKDGTLLAVSTSESGAKVLANSDGFRLLRSMESHTFDTSRVAYASVVKVSPQVGVFPPANTFVAATVGDRSAVVAASVGMNADNRGLIDVKPRLDEPVEKP